MRVSSWLSLRSRKVLASWWAEGGSHWIELMVELQERGWRYVTALVDD